MKKILIFVIFIISFYATVSTQIEKNLEIPKDAIRIRVIPNSNSKKDQNQKQKVKKHLKISLYNLLKDTKNSKEANNKIKNNLKNINNQIHNITTSSYELNYGKNYFPKKNYKGITYNEGYYNSLVVTLGKGKGDNWWCVLYPPLCLLDDNNQSNVKYKSFAKKIINEYM